VAVESAWASKKRKIQSDGSSGVSPFNHGPFDESRGLEMLMERLFLPFPAADRFAFWTPGIYCRSSQAPGRKPMVHPGGLLADCEA
jgi:hypothetical protein